MANESYDMFASFENKNDNVLDISSSLMKVSLDLDLDSDLDLDLDLDTSEVNDQIYVNGECSQYGGPSLRSNLLLRSLEAYKSNNLLESIYFETAALNIGLRNKYPNDKNIGPCFVTKESITSAVKKEVNPLSKYLKSKLNVAKTDSISNGCKTSIKSNVKLNDGIQDLLRQCAEFPKEWKVLQMCKRFNPCQLFGFKEEIISTPLPINITLFKYPRSELLNNEPINIVINEFASGDFFTNSLKVSKSIDTYYSSDKEVKKKVDSLIQANLVETKNYLGPWIVLLSGNNKNSKQQDLIFQSVDKFCDKKYEKRQIVLISLIALRLDLLDNANIARAALFISTNADEETNLNQFFTDLKSKLFKGNNNHNDYYPCLMILDELIDFIPWEMAILDQEFTRLSSFPLLCNLYNKHKNRISNGYLNVNIKKGSSLIDADGTLEQHSLRMRDFFGDQYPSWNSLYQTRPKIEEITKFLHSDVYVYTGHGSGLNYASERDLVKHDISAIVFLFGCSSVGLKSAGLCAEYRAAHMYYHIGLCPTVVGALYVITDFYADLVTTFLISKWAPSNKVKKYRPPINQLWNNVGRYDLFKQDANGNLLKLLSLIRRDMNLPLRVKIPFVSRGLPVINNF